MNEEGIAHVVPQHHKEEKKNYMWFVDIDQKIVYTPSYRCTAVMC